MTHAPSLISFDLETTGLDPAVDRIVEVGALVLDGDGNIVDRFERLINPGRPIAATASAVSGIHDSDVAECPFAAEVLPDFLRLLDRAADAPLIAHNAAFDAGFLGMELARAGLPIPARPVVDTLPLARARLPELRSHRLDLLVAHFGIAPRARHRAFEDAAAVAALWFRLDGPNLDSRAMVSYPIRDGSKAIRPPLGWERLDEALFRCLPVRIAYVGGSRGDAPRLVTPRRFAHRGGIAYLVATCHLDSIEKSFRLDRIRTYEVLDESRPPEVATPCPDCS